MEKQILNVKDLYVKYHTLDYDVYAVNGVSLELNKGESLGIVGETGAGKTTTALAIMGLLPKLLGEVYQGEIVFNGDNLLEAGEPFMREIRGKHISMIFQDPMTSLNPVFTVGSQIEEVLKLHGHKDPDARVDEILNLVGIESSRKSSFPHQFSGGMKQRIVIAMALACEPELLIADEPTTALDVTIQAQVLAMIDDIQKKLGTSLILITHDLGVVAETCDKVAIMYAGEIVEYGTLEQIFDKSRKHHPYTIGLMASKPVVGKKVDKLYSIPGKVPNPINMPDYCYFRDRCEMRLGEQCDGEYPCQIQVSPTHFVSCYRYYEEGKEE